MSEGGYIKLYRKIRDHWIWNEPIYLKWWLDILFMVNHAPGKARVGNELRTIEPGERHTSEIKLAARWFVDRKTVDKFLILLEKDGMISFEKNRKNGTTLKVLNYREYQMFLEDGADNKTDKSMDKSPDKKTAKDSHKQEEEKEEKEEEQEVNTSTPNGIDVAALRQRYTPEQQKVIGEFFAILKHTRVSAKLADNTVLNIYKGWDKHPVQKVIYALHKYIHTPSLHDKKEEYVLGIVRRAKATDIEQYKQKLNKSLHEGDVKNNGKTDTSNPYADIPSLHF